MHIEALPNVNLTSKGKVSDTFLLLGIKDFHQAVEFVVIYHMEGIRLVRNINVS